MQTKTFNIGEYCQGGVISIEIRDTTVEVINRSWDFSKGSLKSSDQTNAPERDRRSVEKTNPRLYQEIGEFLDELTSSYYAALLIDWIKTTLNKKPVQYGASERLI